MVLYTLIYLFKILIFILGMIQGAYTGIGSQQVIFPSLKKHLNGVSSVSLPNGARVESVRTEEHLALPTFNCGKPVFNVAGGIVVDMPKGKFRNELEALLKKLEYAYLKNLRMNDNVQWKEVSLLINSGTINSRD